MALLLLSFPLLASAAPLPAPDAFGIYLNEVVLTTQGSQNWETILVAILLIILGIYTATLGGSGSYLAVYFNGFVSFSTLSTIITWNVEPSTGYSQRAALYLSIWMLTGFTGGLLYGFYPAAGHFLSNAVYGMCWGIQFICLSSGGIFTTTTGRQLFLIPFETIPLVLSFFYPRHTLSVTSALAGPFILVIGLDLFLQTRLLIGVAAFMTFGPIGEKAASYYMFDTTKQIIIGSSIFIGLVCAVFQYRAAVRCFGSKAT